MFVFTLCERYSFAVIASQLGVSCAADVCIIDDLWASTGWEGCNFACIFIWRY